VAKLYAARRAGAVGLVLLSALREWPEPYDLAREQRILPGWGSDAEGQPAPYAMARGELVEKLSGEHNLWEEALAAGFRPRRLPGRLRLELEQEVRRFESPNLIARLPGTDPALAARHVCLSAHWDGLGRSGGKIYNGVIDNAVAVGELLEAARLAREEGPPRRSLLFFFPTAEEAGLLGSSYFVAHPTVPLDDIVGCLNKDGAPEAWGRSTDVVAIAADASPAFGEAIRSGVSRAGLAWSPNPFPSEGFFFRSDHYAFLRAGVPGVLLFLGLTFEGRPPGWGVEQAMLYLKEHYHRSTDDLSQVLDWQGPAQYARLWLALARDLADGQELARGRVDLAPGD
jgi:Zn-dependent M28 family amino/carboxypeptidase